MNCRNCKKQIPEDSAYCPYCGEEVLPEGVCPNCRNELPEDSAFCPYCGTKINTSEVQVPEKNVALPQSGNENVHETDSDDGSNSTKKKNKKYIIAIAVVAALAVIMGILMISQTAQKNNIKQSLEAEISELEADKSELSEEMASLQKERDLYKTNSAKYDAIINNLRIHSVTNSSTRYYSNKQVVYLSQGNSKIRAFEVTCTFNTTCSYEYTAAKGSGTINASWGDFVGDRAPFYITPKHQGVYNFKFTTTTNSSEYFNVLVIID